MFVRRVVPCVWQLLPFQLLIFQSQTEFDSFVPLRQLVIRILKGRYVEVKPVIPCERRHLSAKRVTCPKKDFRQTNHAV